MDKPLKEGVDYYIAPNGMAYYYDAVRALNEAKGNVVDGTNYKNDIKITDSANNISTLKNNEDYYIGNDGKAYYTKGIAAPGFYWPTDSTRITGIFGDTGTRLHRGIDIGVNEVPVYATKDGKVLATGYTKDRGNYIYLDHGYGTQSVYEHLKEDPTNKFKIGETVTQGQVIATSGNTGKSEGPHLHFELLVKVPYEETKNRIGIGKEPPWTWPGGKPVYHENPTLYLPK